MSKSNSIRALKKKAKRLISKNELFAACNIYQPLCKSVPNDLESWHTLADIYYKINQINDAEYCCNHILKINSEYLPASHMLAIINHRKRNYLIALSLYEKSLQHDYNVSETLYLLGTAYREFGNNVMAQKYYEQLLEIESDDFKTLNNLSEIYISAGRISDAIKLLNKADVLQPEHEYITNNLGKAYLIQGNTEKASSLLRSLLDKEQISPDKISNYLLSLNYISTKSVEFIFDEHVRWSKELHNNPSTQAVTKNRHIDTNKPIHIGIISPDLKEHPVVRFMYSFFKHHNSNIFHIYCYSDTLGADIISNEIKNMTYCWRETNGLQDQQLANLISKDNIDIIIDLAGHTAGGRIPLLASRVAPLQVTYVGYPNTTGLKTMDYRFTDNYADPPGISDSIHTEKLLRLKNCFLSYTPDNQDFLIKKPDKNDNMIVFGSFNNLAKTTPKVIETWSKILSRVSHSKLVLKSLSSSDKGVQQYYYDIFESHGINSERIEFLDSLPSKSEHLLCYNSIDIGLDTFPYNGTTTTLEALWMGTPVIALCGDSHVSRVGYSILSNLGYSNLIAESVDEYIDIAVSLANDITQLSELHNTMHDTVAQSCILDHKSHTNEIEKHLLGIIEQHNSSL